MFHFNLLHTPSFPLQNDILERIFHVTSQIAPEAQSGSLNIVFLPDNEIRALNNSYRGKDSTTDVLSFHYYENFSNFQKYDIVGEIVLSEQKILEQGQSYGLGAEHECYKLIIHSVLHILGYDHEEDADYEMMQALEQQIWDGVFEK